MLPPEEGGEKDAEATGVLLFAFTLELASLGPVAVVAVIVALSFSLGISLEGGGDGVPACTATEASDGACITPTMRFGQVGGRWST